MYIGNPYYSNVITIYGINRKSLVKTTFGNMGRGGYACGNGIGGEEIFLSCDYGILYGIISAGYASDASTCSNEVIV